MEMEDTPEIRMIRDKIAARRVQLAEILKRFYNIRTEVAAVSQDLVRLQKELLQRVGEKIQPSLGDQPLDPPSGIPGDEDGEQTVSLDDGER